MTPRKSKPESGNKYYINTKDGGYNKAKGNPKRLNKSLTSLPNCISIYGWFNEIGGKGMKYLSTPWYPYTVIAAARREGLVVTLEPTVGGIMVWTGGKTGEGHVAGVAEIKSPTMVVTSESEYYGKDWVNFTRAKGDGNWRSGCSWMDTSYIYKGCIKNPFMEEDMTKAETEALIKTMVPGIVNEMVPEILTKLEQKRKEMPADSWAEPYIEWAKDNNIMSGDASGNFRPQDSIKREEAAIVSKAVVKAISDKLNELL